MLRLLVSGNAGANGAGKLKECFRCDVAGSLGRCVANTNAQCGVLPGIQTTIIRLHFDCVFNARTFRSCELSNVVERLGVDQSVSQVHRRHYWYLSLRFLISWLCVFSAHATQFVLGVCDAAGTCTTPNGQCVTNGIGTAEKLRCVSNQCVDTTK
jgi:hypothetical protein